MRIELELASDRHGDEIESPERFVIDVNDLGEARIRRAGSPITSRDTSRDTSIGHAITDGNGGAIGLELRVEAKP